MLDHDRAVKIPVRVPLGSEPLGIWGSLKAMQQNVLDVIPEAATRLPIVSGTTGKRWHMIMDPTAIKRMLLDRLDDLVSFDLPPSLVDAEAKQIAHQLWHDENPEVEGHDHPEIEATDEHNKLAERRVRLGLLLAELGQKAEGEVSDAEMTQAVMNQARQYPGQEREFFEFVQQNPQMRQQIQAPLFEDKVVDHIFEQVSVTDKEVSKDDLEKAVEALEEE